MLLVYLSLGSVLEIVALKFATAILLHFCLSVLIEKNEFSHTSYSRLNAALCLNVYFTFCKGTTAALRVRIEPAASWFTVG